MLKTTAIVPMNPITETHFGHVYISYSKFPFIYPHYVCTLELGIPKTTFDSHETVFTDEEADDTTAQTEQELGTRLTKVYNSLQVQTCL
nr:hypothetical transcript [Hymenolepis microstoma]